MAYSLVWEFASLPQWEDLRSKLAEADWGCEFFPIVEEDSAALGISISRDRASRVAEELDGVIAILDPYGGALYDLYSGRHIGTNDLHALKDRLRST